MAEATFAFDLHVLSTPPAFNLSQNQTLQFKSVLRFLLTQKSESQSSLNHSLFTFQWTTSPHFHRGAVNVYAPFRSLRQELFSIIWKKIFLFFTDRFVPLKVPFKEALNVQIVCLFSNSLSRSSFLGCKKFICNFYKEPITIFPKEILLKHTCNMLFLFFLVKNFFKML